MSHETPTGAITPETLRQVLDLAKARLNDLEVSSSQDPTQGNDAEMSRLIEVIELLESQLGVVEAEAVEISDRES